MAVDIDLDLDLGSVLNSGIAHLAARKLDVSGKEINCIIAVDVSGAFGEQKLAGLQADGWVIIPQLKFERLLAMHNEGKKWFWDSRNIPYSTEAERNAAEATYREG
jgi:hypothetical protein